MATEILTTRAVADQFGVTPSAVTRWVADGKLQPMTKVPGIRGAWLFTREAVEQFAATRNN